MDGITTANFAGGQNGILLADEVTNGHEVDSIRQSPGVINQCLVDALYSARAAYRRGGICSAPLAAMRRPEAMSRSREATAGVGDTNNATSFPRSATSTTSPALTWAR